MNWPKLKSLRAGRLARTAAMLALAGAAIGGTTVLTAGAASAAIGTSPGTLVLTPGGSTASPTTTSPTWSTTVGCPSGFQSSAVVKEVHADGTTTNNVSVFVNSATVPLTGPIPAQPLQATMAQIQTQGGIPNGGTQELFVTCFAGNSGTGASQPFMNTFVTYSADGTTYTTSNTQPATTTTTTLTAAPSPATTGQTVTLTATEVAADTTHPAGQVQFMNGATAIGTPVAVNASGVATTTTSFATAGTEALSAVFTPTSTSFSGSTGTFSLTVNQGTQTGTTTTLTAAPSPANTGQTVTLTATEVAADNTHPAGQVQFEVGGTAIGAPVAVNASGVATTTTTFAAGGTEALSAVFTPTSATYASSTGTFSLTVNVPVNTGTEPIAVTVPATGAFTLTVATGTVTLTSNSTGTSATGALNPVTVSDTRNTFPGWSVSGQESDFAGSGTAAGHTISGNQLGWVPTDTSLATGATLGGTVTPAAPGLGTTAAVLAQAHAATPGSGSGTSVLGANLTLLIPAGTFAGPYAGVMTVTAVTALP